MKGEWRSKLLERHFLTFDSQDQPVYSLTVLNYFVFIFLTFDSQDHPVYSPYSSQLFIFVLNVGRICLSWTSAGYGRENLFSRVLNFYHYTVEMLLTGIVKHFQTAERVLNTIWDESGKLIRGGENYGSWVEQISFSASGYPGGYPILKFVEIVQPTKMRPPASVHRGLIIF